MNILLIEDSVTQIKVFETLLVEAFKGKEEYKFIAVKSLKEGINIAINSNVDVVFLDLFLEDSSDVIKTIELFLTIVKKLPVIILSASKDEETIEKAISFGAQDYIIKEDLNVTTIRMAIKQAQWRNTFIQQGLVLKELLHLLRKYEVKESLDNQTK